MRATVDRTSRNVLYLCLVLLLLHSTCMLYRYGNLPSAPVIGDEVTINDPGAYTKPFTTQGTARLQPPGDEIIEYICQENNIDLIHVNAPAQLP